jgi:spermidine synthase
MSRPGRPAAAAILALAGLLVSPAAPAEQVLHRQKSLYRDILVTESGGERCMTFSVRSRSHNRQSCIRPDAPDRLVLDYTRLMMAGLYVQPAPRRILVVGLGGGILPRSLAKLLPDATIDSVEIDEAVVDVAKKWFLFAPSDRVRVAVQDGRVYVKRALKNGTRYDLVFLDAYDHEYVPEHLLTREFLQEVRGLLAPGGAVVANTFSSSRLYDSESATYAAVFGSFQQLRTGNRVILAGALPAEATRRARAEKWREAFRPLGVEPEWLLGRWEERPTLRRARASADRPVLAVQPAEPLTVPGPRAHAHSVRPSRA